MSRFFCTNLRRLVLAVAAIAAIGTIATDANAQFFRNPSVGGVKIDTDGVLSNPQVGELKQLQAAWQKGLEQVPADLEKWTDLRFVSLKQLESEVAAARAAGKQIPESVRYMAGLQRVRYVLVYPEKQDIVLAGPAEGWKVDTLGCVVGATSNRPVLTLDDLMVALRVAEGSNGNGISCSIDPTLEGMQRMQQLSGQLDNRNGPQAAAKRMEDAVGMQTISVTGVPETSHFARVLVAADFRMKRIAMDFEPAPVKGMPSFLTMVNPKGRGMNNLLPRWWLAPNYEPLARTADGLGWELRGQGVKCMSNEDYVDSTGQKTNAVSKNPAAEKWAATMTEKYPELAERDSSFGELRNIMDLAVIGALIEKERLLDIANLQLPRLMGEQPIERYPAPKQTASKASAIKQRGGWVISASGGVEMLPWHIAGETETVDAVGDVRGEMSADVDEIWWE